MDFQTYFPLALRTAKLFLDPRNNLQHAALGLCTEIGEFATEVKRITIYEKPMTEVMRQHMVEEIGDVMWYVPLALQTLGFDGLSEDYKAPQDVPQDIGRATIYCSTVQAGLACCLIEGTAFDERKEIAYLLTCMVYVIDTVIAPALSTTGDEIRAANIAKLRLRFPDKYSDDAAEARTDKGGLSALVS